jgi:hypothetical protein
MKNLQQMTLNDFESGVLLGILIGEGHFGGHRAQPCVTVRMHVRHETLMTWLWKICPGSRLYGPYDHGGRHYYHWTVRGAALRRTLIPWLDRLPLQEIDPHAFSRYQEMKKRYGL